MVEIRSRTTVGEKNKKPSPCTYLFAVSISSLKSAIAHEDLVVIRNFRRECCGVDDSRRAAGQVMSLLVLSNEDVPG